MNTIEWTTKALRQLTKVGDRNKRVGIYDRVQVLASWPQCDADIKKLIGRDDYRLRMGDYRIVFRIDQSSSPPIITIVQVEKRNERTY
jgi:mRNA interferase RelE/StbE